MGVLKNARHERFAQELAKGKSADEAYQAAGFKPNRGNAATLKAKQSISNRVDEILSRAAEKAEVTIETIAAQLDADREFARECGQASACVSASMGKAKLFGLLKEKHELTGKDGGPIETADVSAREIVERRILGIASRSGEGQGSSKPH